jgi:hypothetical protein
MTSQLGQTRVGVWNKIYKPMDASAISLERV